MGKDEMVVYDVTDNYENSAFNRLQTVSAFDQDNQIPNVNN